MSAGLPPLMLDRRFTGPPTSANGGYTAGRLAAYVDGSAAVAVAVTLHQPPLLETPLVVTAAGANVRATFGGALIAEAVPTQLRVDPVEPVSYGRAVEAAARYPGWDGHPFPTCFSCGSDREAPDALALRPGPVEGREGDRACPWVPDPSLPRAAGSDGIEAAVVWAALDCPGGWTLDLAGRPAVLGRMTAQVDVVPRAGDRCVVVGRLLGRQGRKAFTATTLYDSDGRVLGRAHAVWIGIDPATFSSGESR